MENYRIPGWWRCEVDVVSENPGVIIHDMTDFEGRLKRTIAWTKAHLQQGLC
jgi:hypothetical protein